MPGEYCSYSYHMPFRENYDDAGRPITAVSSPGSPVCADRNPYMNRNADDYINEPPPPTYDPTAEGYVDIEKHGNSASHQQEGQNVLYQDIHVEFEKFPNVGTDKDNIYKRWQIGWTTPTQEQMQVGGQRPLQEGDGWPESDRDAYLVNEKNEK